MDSTHLLPEVPARDRRERRIIGFVPLAWGMLVLVWIAANAVSLVRHNGESSVFVAFRFEGQLFFKNALEHFLATGNPIFFFIRDWSTSPASAEHPLYYFHNLDALHVLAGALQFVFAGSPWSLVPPSLAVSALGFALIWHQRQRFPPSIFFFFAAIILFIPHGFLFASANLLLATLLVALVAVFVVFCDFVAHPRTSWRWRLSVAGLFFTLAAVETNTAILSGLLIAVGGFVSALLGWLWLDRANARRRLWAIAITLTIAAVATISTRLLQLVVIYANDLGQLLLADVTYTRKVKLEGSVTLVDSVHYYEQHGLTFFGVLGKPSFADTLRTVAGFLYENFGLWLPVALVLAAACIVAWGRDMVLQRSPVRAATVMMGLYLCSFLIALAGVVALTGMSIVHLAFTRYAFLDLLVIARPVVLLLAPMVVLELPLSIAPRLRLAAAGLLLLAASGVSAGTFTSSRNDQTNFAPIIRQIPAGSEVVSNFDIAPIAQLSASRVVMNWYANLPSTCELGGAPDALRIYRGGPQTQSDLPTYLLLAFFPPYGGSKLDTKERYCLRKLDHIMMFEDDSFGLYFVVR